MHFYFRDFYGEKSSQYIKVYTKQHSTRTHMHRCRQGDTIYMSMCTLYPLVFVFLSHSLISIRWEILSFVGRDINGGDYFIAFTNGRCTICCDDRSSHQYSIWMCLRTLGSSQVSVCNAKLEINVTCSSSLIIWCIHCCHMRLHAYNWYPSNDQDVKYANRKRIFVEKCYRPAVSVIHV